MSARGIRGQVARTGGALAVVALMALLPRHAAAAEPAGRVIFGVGDTVAVAADGSERALGRGDDVHVGETLVTGPRGRVQVRFDDGALLDLKPDSRFGLDEYRERTGDEGGSVLMRLFKGAMRTITGAIGRGADDEYRVDTPVATIGIRGTEYSLQYCDADCAGAGRAPGLYGRTDDGRIRVSNAHGTSGFDAGQHFFVPPGGPPELLLTPPPGVLDGTENRRTGRPGGDEDDRVPGGITIDKARAALRGLDFDAERFAALFRQADDRGEDAATRLRADGVQFAGAIGGGGLIGRELYVSTSPGQEVWIDGGGAVIEADFPSLGQRLGTATVDASRTRLAEFGSTTAGDADVAWGRWAGTFTLDGTAFDGGFSFAYVDAADLTSNLFLESSVATINYTNFSGPAAVDASGGIWNVDALQFTADLQVGDIFLDTLQVTNTADGDTIQFDRDVRAIDIDANGILLNSFTMTDLSGQLGETGFIQGRFIGSRADGVFVLFQIDQVQAGDPSIVGTQTVTR